MIAEVKMCTPPLTLLLFFHPRFSVQYLVTLGQTFWALRRNPHCSADCCLSLVLTLQEVGDVATSSQPPQIQQETFSEDLNASGLVTAAAEREEVTDEDAAQDDTNGGQARRKVK